MIANPMLGVVFHWLGGLASGSFYVPYRAVRKWSWEVYWLVGGFFSWIIAPWILGAVMTGVLLPVLHEAPGSSCFWAYFWGVMWGLGGLTFGLTMRYLGMSLGMAVALSYCSAFGTIMPPLFDGKLIEKFSGPSGHAILVGIIVCLLGIAVTGMAGMFKDKEMPEEKKKKAIKEFNFWKGIAVATFSGVMSASFSYGLTAGNPIKELTLKHTFVKSAQADQVAVSFPAPVASEAEKDLWVEIQKAQIPAVVDMAKSFKDIKNVRCGDVATYLEKESAIPAENVAAITEFLTGTKKTAATTALVKYMADRSKITVDEVKKQAAEYTVAPYLEKESAKSAENVAAITAFLTGTKNPAAAELVKYMADRSKITDNEVKKQATEYTSFDLKQATLQIAVAGGDIKKYVSKHTLWQGLPVLVVVLLGGFTTNFIWCLLLNIKNKTGYQYFSSTLRKEPPKRTDETIIETALDAPSEEVVEHIAGVRQNALERVPMLSNYFFSALAGVTWYMQFFFYSMGETQMGRYKFSSWTLHMASIIIFSSLWGIALLEWKGSSRKTHVMLALGLLTLIGSTVIVGYGNYLATL